VRKAIVFCLLAAVFVSAQSKSRVAVLPTVNDDNALDPQRQIRLADKVREVASKTLPPDKFILLKQDAIVNIIGEEELYRSCKEGVCIAELTKKISADYGARCESFKIDNDLALKFELYSVKDEAIVETFTQYKIKDFYAMLDLLDKHLPGAFKKMLEMSKNREAVSGISSVEYGGRNYTVSLNTTPQGAGLSFNGVPVDGCGKSPCKVELPEGSSVRIIAALTQYETADTMVAINQNNQNITISLKPNIGLLAIKPAYSENIGSNKGWSLSINGKGYSSYENALPPGSYTVKLSHECYEDMSFRAAVAKGKSEIFDMTQHLRLKTGVLVLSAEKGGESVSEPVFANGKQIGETPFNGAVPVCAEITIGNDRKRVNVTAAHNQTVQYKHIIPVEVTREAFTADRTLSDGRDKIQEQQAIERAKEQQRQEAEQAQKSKRKNNIALGTAIGFDIAGAGLVAYGWLYENARAKKIVNDAKGKDPGEYDVPAYKNAVNTRDAVYWIGGALLAAGVSIHIIF